MTDQPTTTDRLGHCTSTWGGHSPACDRDGTYCSLSSTHSGECQPHGTPRTILQAGDRVATTRGQSLRYRGRDLWLNPGERGTVVEAWGPDAHHLVVRLDSDSSMLPVIASDRLELLP